jgi:hypothetical protein
MQVKDEERNPKLEATLKNSKLKCSKLEKVSEVGFKNDFGFRHLNFEFLVRKGGE